MESGQLSTLRKLDGLVKLERFDGIHRADCRGDIKRDLVSDVEGESKEGKQLWTRRISII